MGREVVRELRERGHEVRALSRSAPEHRVDVLTGEGLHAALAGCAVVVDASNQQAALRGGSQPAAASRRLLEDGPVPFTTVRATQFHELLELAFSGLARVRVLRELAAAWRSARRRRALQLPLPLPGALGKALRAGVLTSDSPDVRGTIAFERWLSSPTT